MEKMFLPAIREIVESAIVLHNMMVECRVENDEIESPSFCDIVDDEEINGPLPDIDEEEMECAHAELALQQRIDAAFYQGTAISMAGMEHENWAKWMAYHAQVRE
jgi:hypothetical protein